MYAVIYLVLGALVVSSFLVCMYLQYIPIMLQDFALSIVVILIWPAFLIWWLIEAREVVIFRRTQKKEIPL